VWMLRYASIVMIHTHVGVKRIKKLHNDGLLGSLDFDSFDTYELFLLGKMIRTPFTGTIGRVSDLLGYIRMCLDQ
jgi:hypothetical protein